MAPISSSACCCSALSILPSDLTVARDLIGVTRFVGRDQTQLILQNGQLVPTH
jgi:hypothetical protein